MIRRNGRPSRHRAGFTLIEQIMVLAILAVLTTLAAPSLRRMSLRYRMRAQQMGYIAAMHHARSVAITRNIPTLICPTRDGQHCAGSSSWDSGWLLGADRNGDDQPDDTPFHVDLSEPGQVAVRSSAGRQHALFRPDGTALGTNLTLVICQRGQPEQALAVIVANSGRVRGAPASSDQAAACALDG